MVLIAALAALLLSRRPVAAQQNRASSDALLSSLTVSPKDIHAFGSEIFGYVLSMPSTATRATIVAVPWDANATTVEFSRIDADPNMGGYQAHLNPGVNDITIEVTAGDGITWEAYKLVIGPGVTNAYGWKGEDDFDSLHAGGNLEPRGIWSDGATVWAADGNDGSLLAYRMTDKQREPARDIGLADDNSDPQGIWSDGVIMWVADSGQDKLFAYRMSDKERQPGADIILSEVNGDPRGIWADETGIWVVDAEDGKLYAYNRASHWRDWDRDLILASRNREPFGVWSNGVAMWVTEMADEPLTGGELYAHLMTDGARDPGKDFTLPHINRNPVGTWGAGKTLWVAEDAFADHHGNRLFSYNLPADLQLVIDAGNREITIRDTSGEPPHYKVRWRPEGDTGWRDSDDAGEGGYMRYRTMFVKEQSYPLVDIANLDGGEYEFQLARNGNIRDHCKTWHQVNGENVCKVSERVADTNNPSCEWDDAIVTVHITHGAMGAGLKAVNMERLSKYPGNHELSWVRGLSPTGRDRMLVESDFSGQSCGEDSYLQFQVASKPDFSDARHASSLLQSSQLTGRGALNHWAEHVRLLCIPRNADGTFDEATAVEIDRTAALYWHTNADGDSIKDWRE